MKSISLGSDQEWFSLIPGFLQYSGTSDGKMVSFSLADIPATEAELSARASSSSLSYSYKLGEKVTRAPVFSKCCAQGMVFDWGWDGTFPFKTDLSKHLTENKVSASPHSVLGLKPSFLFKFDS